MKGIWNLMMLCMFSTLVLATHNYTFYNDEGDLVIVGEPQNCSPAIGNSFPMWTNETFSCSDKLFPGLSFIFMQAFFGPPYIKLFECDIIANNTYYIISDCEFRKIDVL